MITKADVFAVHEMVNGCAQWVSDLENYRKSEYWTDIMEAAGKKGDCDDFMIGKANLMLARKCPVEQLRFAFYRTPDGWHVVLFVDIANPESDTGWQTYALSNGITFPMVKEDIPADWVLVSMQKAGTDRWELP